MADLTPNDLSHLSDEEFLALCPQGEHAPGPEPLSPAAEAVLDAALPHQVHRYAAAAALRKLADQVVCADPTGAPDCCISIMEEIRAAILAIATELEGK